MYTRHLCAAQNNRQGSDMAHRKHTARKQKRAWAKIFNPVTLPLEVL